MNQLTAKNLQDKRLIEKWIILKVIKILIKIKIAKINRVNSTTENEWQPLSHTVGYKYLFSSYLKNCLLNRQ